MGIVVHAHRVPESTKDCSRCRRQTVPEVAWRRADKGQRKAWRDAGAARYWARGLCASCYTWLRRHGGLIDHERTTYTYAELLEEWERAYSPYTPKAPQVRALAERLGMTVSAVESALRRRVAA